MTQLLILQTYGVAAFTLIGYLLSRILKRNDIADSLWGLGFIAVALIHVSQVSSLSFRAKLVLALTLIWGLRLAIHLGIRTYSHNKEDIRYANWRREWKKSEPLFAFLKVFLLQGIVLGLVSLPLAFSIQSSNNILTPYDFLGVCLFLIGFVFESISDLELMIFKRNKENQGKVIKTGLWSLSRHPNYFGEILIWWGFFFLSVSLPHSLMMVISPLLITYLLMNVSGVPMLENVMKSKGSEFENYVKKTPALFPFNLKDISQFLFIALILVVLDLIWLGFLMNKFYFAETISVARISNGTWDVLYWPVIGVYFFIALGIKQFAITNIPSRSQSVFRATILGMTIYSVYDFTNLSLVNQWSLQMSIVDIIWGGTLCGATAMISYEN
ncbi:MAG: DUF2177 family protein [Xanthomonadaceae bacterium]|nr:DUF2177 family protein [Xanthomonadaceae bacterium]